MRLSLSRLFGKKIPISQYITNKQPISNTTHLKNRLFAEGLLEKSCEWCGLQGWWGRDRLVLELDHINGNRKDNRLENLRILCPNCHSQTPTFRGRKR